MLIRYSLPRLSIGPWSPECLDSIVSYIVGSITFNLLRDFQVAALLTLVIIIAINLAVGILPHVDNFAHIGGFASGFLLGFVFLIRPQFGWVAQRYGPAGYSSSSRPKFKIYQCVLWIVSLILVIVG